MQNTCLFLQHTSFKAVGMGMGIDMRVQPKMQKEVLKLKQRNADIRNLVSLLIAEKERDSQGQWTPGYVHHTVFYKMDWLKRITNDTVW